MSFWSLVNNTFSLFTTVGAFVGGLAGAAAFGLLVLVGVFKALYALKGLWTRLRPRSPSKASGALGYTRVAPRP